VSLRHPTAHKGRIIGEEATAAFAYSLDPHTDLLVHASVLERSIWRGLSVASRPASAGVMHDELDAALARWRAALLDASEPSQRNYRLKVLDLVAERLRDRLERSAR
jgi:hypothetical protein